MKNCLGLTIVLTGSCLLMASCGSGTGLGGGDLSFSGSVVVGHELARESVLRAIPPGYINTARTTLHVAYQHTSHGTHVSYGLFGLQDYKSGDSTKFAVSTSGAAGKLDYKESIPGAYVDLSTADANWTNWINQVSAYLDDPANAAINVMMWSWCDISDHDVAGGYLPSMQTLINKYGVGGTKIGTGTGMRATPVTFVFMTGHAGANYSGNVGAGKPKNQADLITAYCESRGYLCLDYWSIDSHDMAGIYYNDATDDASSAVYGGNYNQAWQDAHYEGMDWFYNRNTPDISGAGNYDPGQHLSQHITSNRKAYAMWYILARIAGWDGESL